MKKQIRLLIENLFDDEFNNIYNDTDLDTDITDEYMGYSVGDIIYENKKPYAICCGDKKDFKDNKPRFMYLKIYKEGFLKWSKITKTIPELKIYDNAFDFDTFKLFDKSSIKHIDEDGYENTQIIKNNYNIYEFPAFRYCCDLGDDFYLPAIDELQILFLNSFNYNYNLKIPKLYDYWSSSQLIEQYCFIIESKAKYSKTGNFVNIQRYVSGIVKNDSYNKGIISFIKYNL